jgi:hypothetical protein
MVCQISIKECGELVYCIETYVTFPNDERIPQNLRQTTKRVFYRSGKCYIDFTKSCGPGGERQSGTELTGYASEYATKMALAESIMIESFCRAFGI